MKAVGAHITGRVQGVAFRAWTKVEAQSRGLSGWVRNEPDGSVRAVLAGPEPAVDEMLKAMEAGPPAAIVATVEIEAATAPEDDGFAILR
ncbi:MAG: acylphosphatase [Alphaproteobacteria bacterium]|jgi:acylphosphatase|nr:acylphosphatase [Alphaproteobacteria bacterium]